MTECQTAISQVQVYATLIVLSLLIVAIALMADSVRSVAEKADDE